MPTTVDLQPRLTGRLLELRPLAPGDRDALLEAAGDPLIWEQHPERDRWRPDVFRRYFDEGLASGGALAIVERATGRVVGSSRYHRWNAEAREIDIGWTFLVRRLWGGEHNGELKRLMLDHAFRFADRVRFVIGEDNLRSRRAVEKLGARLTDTVVDGPGGARHVVYALTPADRLDAAR